MSIRVGQTTASCSLHFDPLCISVIIAICYREKLLWLGARAILICGYTDKLLECNQKLYLFSKVALVCSLLGAVFSPAKSNNWLGYNTRHGFSPID